MPLLDVRADHLKIVQDILQKHVPEREVWAFGSRAKWLAKEYSDLDLCIVGETPLSFRTLGLLEEAFEDSDLPYKVDVVDWATTSESFRKIVERDKVVVQKAGRGWGMAAEWQTCTLGELGPIKTGKTPPSSLGDGFGGTVPFLTPGDMNGKKWITETDRYLNEIGLNAVRSSLMPARSVAVSCIGSDMGKAALLARASVTNQQINTIAVDESRFNAEFVYYDLSVRQQELKAAASGSATPILNKGHFSAFEISLPPRATQNKIVGILGGLDNKIDLNRRINQTLEAMAQAVFKSWFVDFDPVKAKIAARRNLAPNLSRKEREEKILRAAMSAISGKPDAELDTLPPEQYQQLAATAALFPDEMEESELGEIPRGWAPGALSAVCDLNADSWSAKTLPASVKYIDLANTKNGEVIEVQTMEGANIPSRARRILKDGDTIIGTVRPGNRSFALVGEAGLTGSAGFAVLHPRKSYLREYVYLAATADANIERLAHLADGGAYPAVRPELVVSDSLPIPSENLLREFHRISAPMFDHVLEMRRANRELAALRDTLLPKLLSGELSVENLSSNLEAMA
ncbi:restriction endonuclease subunit S [Halothiobacillus sp. DCM-1]|uniref:restriction endonuclease subunit S n=1 Tax=Halothiobacillus sp. DCM-1 TaxID=3112558 RepID=UPI00324D9B52